MPHRVVFTHLRVHAFTSGSRQVLADACLGEGWAVVFHWVGFGPSDNTASETTVEAQRERRP